ncbi:MAG: hypothetical protein QW753_04825 [Thermofilum sp.]
MAVLDRVVERYRRVVALVSGDVRRYRSASKEFKTALCLTPLSLAIPLALYHSGVLRDADLLVPLGMLLGVAAWLRVLDTVTALQSLRRRLEEELPFFALAAAAASRTGLEPVELLRFLANSRVFQAFKELGKRFWGLSEAFGSSEGLSMLSRIAGGRVRLFLSEYSASLASGTALQHLRDRAVDFVKTVAVDVGRALSNRVVAATATSMGFSVAPVILISVATLHSVSVESWAVEVPAVVKAIPPSILLVSLLVASYFPDYPMAARVVVDGKTMLLYRASYYVGITVLLLPLAEAYAWGSALGVAPYCGAAAAALGLPAFASFLRALLLRVDDVVEEMARHVRVYRSMLLFRSEKLESLVKKRVRPWLVDYLGESVEFFRLLGDVDPSVFDLFVVFVFEVQRSVRSVLKHVGFMLAVVAISPMLSAATVALASGLGAVNEGVLVGYASCLSFGLVASKVALGRNVSTFLPGLSLVVYSLSYV